MLDQFRLLSSLGTDRPKVRAGLPLRGISTSRPTDNGPGRRESFEIVLTQERSVRSNRSLKSCKALKALEAVDRQEAHPHFGGLLLPTNKEGGLLPQDKPHGGYVPIVSHILWDTIYDRITSCQ